MRAIGISTPVYDRIIARTLACSPVSWPCANRGGVMSTEPSKSPLHFFAELGDLLARYITQPGYAIALAIVSWVIWPVGALIASLLIASLHQHAHQPPGSMAEPSLTAPAGRHTDEDWLVLGGIILIGIGVYWLAWVYIPQLPWALVIMAFGLLLILLGLAR